MSQPIRPLVQLTIGQDFRFVLERRLIRVLSRLAFEEVVDRSFAWIETPAPGPPQQLRTHGVGDLVGSFAFGDPGDRPGAHPSVDERRLLGDGWETEDRVDSHVGAKSRPET